MKLSVTKKVIGIGVVLSIVFILVALISKSYYIQYMEQEGYEIATNKLLVLLDEEIKLKKEVGSSNVAGLSIIKTFSLLDSITSNFSPKNFPEIFF